MRQTISYGIVPIAAAISRTSICCQLSVTLTTDEHDFVARLYFAEFGHVDRHHVHRDGADDRHAASSNEHLPVLAEPQVETIRVARRYDRDCGRTMRIEPAPVADRFPGREAL